jgi:hypothetical protein
MAPSPAQKVSASPRALGVYPVVEQVTVLRHQAAGARCSVIGPEDPGDHGLGAEGIVEAAQRIPVHGDVGIDEHQDIAAGMADSAVARRRGAAALGLPQYDIGEARRDVGGRIAAGIVHHDQLPGLARQVARPQRGERFGEEGGAVADRDDDRQPWPAWVRRS